MSGGIDWEKYAEQQYASPCALLAPLPRMPRVVEAALTVCTHIAWTLVPVLARFEKVSSPTTVAWLLCASVYAQFIYHTTEFERPDGKRQYPFGKTLLCLVVVIPVVYTATIKPGETELCWDHTRGAHTRLYCLAALTMFEHFLRSYALSPSSSSEEEKEQVQQEER